MVLFIIAAAGLAVIVLVISVFLLLSNKPINHIIAKIKYDLIYNIIGSKSLLEDIVLRDKNDSAGKFLCMKLHKKVFIIFKILSR